ncbi:MAG TPA: hypothetical protein VEG26_12635 [Steroidobacteraceae bacterium]|nr:hypothetical protein [Steroidobacteraceae bacterium]
MQLESCLLGVKRQRPARLAELAPLRLDDQREVGVARGREAKGALQSDLPGRVVEEVRAPDDVGHALPRVIDHHGELVGERPVAASHYDVSTLSQTEPADPLRAVFECQLRVIDSESRSSGSCAFRAVAARAGVAPLGALAARAAALESQAARPEALERLGVMRRAGTLVFDHAVPGEAVRLEGPQQRIRAAPHHALAIEVLDADQPAAAVTTRVEETPDGGDQRAEVQWAGG